MFLLAGLAKFLHDRPSRVSELSLLSSLSLLLLMRRRDELRLFLDTVTSFSLAPFWVYGDDEVQLVLGLGCD